MLFISREQGQGNNISPAAHTHKFRTQVRFYGWDPDCLGRKKQVNNAL